jgi:hypothetical protein
VILVVADPGNLFAATMLPPVNAQVVAEQLGQAKRANPSSRAKKSPVAHFDRLTLLPPAGHCLRRQGRQTPQQVIGIRPTTPPGYLRPDVQPYACLWRSGCDARYSTASLRSLGLSDNATKDLIEVNRIGGDAKGLTFPQDVKKAIGTASQVAESVPVSALRDCFRIARHSGAQFSWLLSVLLVEALVRGL